MKPLRACTLALSTLGRNRLRSALMMLGVAIGVGALTGVWSISATTRRAALAMMKRSVGSYDTLIIHPGGGRANSLRALLASATALSLDDFRALNEGVPGIARAVALQTLPSATVKYNDQEASVPVYGISEHWHAVRGDVFASGGPLSPDDFAASARSVVLGAEVKRTLFGDADALGATVRIADVPFAVAGVLAATGAGFNPMDSRDNKVYVPLSTLSRRLVNSNYLSLILLQMEDPDDAATAIAAVSALLRQRHGIVPPAADDFSVVTPRTAIVRVGGIGATLNRVLNGVAAAAILVGGVVIVALMLVGVTERRSEVGLRRAIGATRTDIAVQFLAEALALSCGGGLLGALTGALLIRLAKAGGMPSSPDWAVLAAVTGVAVGLGLVFGIVPAWKASRVDPVQALRS
jgi:putative ABC transport system permease protein